MSKPSTDYASELYDAVKLFIDQPLNNPLTRSQIMDIARISLPLLEQRESGGFIRVAFTGSGSLEAIKRGDEGFIWGSRQDAHPIELFVHSKDAVCVKCNGTGEMDSGGTQPWGEQIPVKCDCQLKQQVPCEGEWIEWGGKGKPVEATPKMIEVKLRDGDTAIELASLWRWSHYGDETDIIAYRVVKP
ncbi:hypothetical protein [Pantoea stewartii]|uniref:hypothetical protein n=1 Tax=Pantoea stewartii TaxID=66269 RepID=UPI0019821726|nr:hypothetical protein [Pantoea stewartii]